MLTSPPFPPVLFRFEEVKSDGALSARHHIGPAGLSKTTPFRDRQDGK